MWNNQKKNEELRSNFRKPKEQNINNKSKIIDDNQNNKFNKESKVDFKKSDKKDFRPKTQYKNKEEVDKVQIIKLSFEEEQDIETRKEIEAEQKYKPPVEWIKKLYPCIPYVISSRIITKEEYDKSYE